MTENLIHQQEQSEKKDEWYVLHTRSRHENVVYEGLLKKSKEVFFPKVRVRSKRIDRKAMIQVPLFPGYLFVKTHLTPHSHIEIVKTAGVVRLVGNQSGPIPVPDKDIESLKIMVKTDKAISTGMLCLKKGSRIMVISGPFAGVSGVFVRYKGIGRVVVYIEVLGQCASVDVDEDDIEVLPEILL